MSAPRQKLTVLMPVKNERLNIRPCIESVLAVADEILVADSGSTDETMAIAREYGARIIEREYIDSGNFKNWTIPQAKHEWVLIVDGDERVSPALAQEIQRTLEAPQHDGYRIGRQNFFLGHEIKHCGWANDAVMRLFKRDVGRYNDIGDHADVQIPTGKRGRLKAKFIHFTYWSMEQYLRKLDRYTYVTAKHWREHGKKSSVLKLALQAPARFVQLYFLKGGFLDGVPGLVLCWLTAFYSFTKVAKLWALEHGLEQPDPEAEHAAKQDTARRAA